MALDNETGLDPAGIRVRPVSGLVAADYFAPGYFVWAVLIENLARIGYEEKNMYMAAYDWRLTFQNNEVLSHTPPHGIALWVLMLIGWMFLVRDFLSICVLFYRGSTA